VEANPVYSREQERLLKAEREILIKANPHREALANDLAFTLQG
jgi:hypothetical protein